MRVEKQKTILLVEDEVITAMAEKMILEKYGYTVIIANTGEEAVAAVAKTPGIDLILMDINLGAGIDGTEAAMIILNQRDLPVVFLSSHMEPEVVAKTEKITSYGYVVKASSGTVLDASIKMAFKLFEAITKEQEKESQMEAALEALRESEERLNFHINNSLLATIEWTTDLIVTRWSAEAEKTFGWNQSETIGKTIMDLQMIYDEDIPMVQKTMELLSNGSSKHAVSTNRNYTKEGKVIICEWYNSVLLDPQGKMISLMSQGIDVTARKQVEEELRVRSRVIDSALDSVFIHDVDGNILYVNESAAKTRGYTRNEMIGMNLSRLDTPEFAPLSQPRIKELLKTDQAGFDSVHRCKDGSLMPIAIQAQLIEYQGRTAVLGIVRDITERKRAESQMEATLEALQESEEKLRVLFEQLPIGVSLLGKNRKIMYVNPALGKILDISKDDLLQEKYQTRRYIRPDGTTLPPEEFTSVRAFKEQKLIRDIEIGVITESGKTIWTSVSAAPFPMVTEGLLIITADITERKQAEAALRESEVRFRELFNRMSSGVAVYEAVDDGEDFIFRDFNPAAEKIEKISRRDILGKRVSEIFPGVKVFGVFKVFKRVWQTGKPEYYPENIYKDEKNSGSWRESWVFKLPTGEIVAIYNDITERKQAESQREAALEALWESEVRFRRVSALTSDIAYSCRTKEDGCFSIDWLTGAAELITGYSGEEIKTQGCWRFLVIGEDLALFEENVIGLAPGSQGSCELRLRHKNGGIVWIASCAECVAQAQTPGRLLLYGGLVDISTRKLAESQREAALEALRKSEALYQALIETSPDAIVLSDLNGTITMLNQQLAKLHGYESKVELIGKCAFELFAPEDRQRAVDNMGRAMETEMGEIKKFECVLLRKDGTRFWGELYGKLILSANEKSPLMLTIVRDITERKQAETLLQKERELYLDLVNNQPVGIYRLRVFPREQWQKDAWHSSENSPYSLELVNDRFCEILGINRQVFETNPGFLNDLIYIEDKAEFVRKNEEANVKLIPFQWEGRLFIKGKILWVHFESLPRPVENGDVLWMGTLYDITERKQAESQREAALAALREREEELRQLFKSMINAFALFDSIFDDAGNFTSYRFVYINDAYERITGVKNKEVKGKSVQEVWPETEPEWIRRYGEVAVTGVSQEFEMYHDPTKKLFHCNVYRPWNRKGRFCVIFEDITERKQAEMALKESEGRYRSILNASPNSIAITDMEGHIIMVSPAAMIMFGFNREEDVLGRLFLDFVDPGDRERAGSSVAHMFKSSGTELGEYRGLRPDGTSIDVVVNSGFVLGAEGRPTHMVFVIRDISERKRTEKELSESKALIDAVIENVPLMIFLKEAVDLRFVIFNRAGEELLGYDRKSLLGKNNLDLFPPEQAAHFMAKDREVLDGEAGMLDIPEEPILTAKKGTRLLHTRKVCIHGADGATKYLLGISEDITERKQAEEEIKRQLAEKEIMLKEVHHRIKNNIASIGGLLSLQMQSITNPEAIAVLQEALGRVNSMRILYDKLLLSESYKDISVKKYLDDLIDTIVAIFPDKAKIKLGKRISDFQLDPKRLFPLGSIINELLTNTMKYAFINRDAGIIKISITNVGGHVTLNLQDNGSGLPAGFDLNKSKGFGLMLVKMLSQQLGGSFSIKKHAGTRCIVEFNI